MRRQTTARRAATEFFLFVTSYYDSQIREEGIEKCAENVCRKTTLNVYT
jgi:hypothetical protein